MPFRHVVMFRWREGVEPDHVTRLRAALDRLPLEIDEIRSYLHGSDAGVSEGNYDYAVVADFDSAADYRVYRDHPQHQLVIAELIKDFVSERAAVQYQYGPG